MLDVLLEASLRATLIAAAAFCALWLFRTRAAGVRHRVWTVVMVAMLALPFSIAFVPAIALQVLPRAEPSAPSNLAPSSVFDASVGDSRAPLEPAVAQATAYRALELAPPAASGVRVGLLALYFAGVAVLLTRLLIGTVRVRSLARGARIVNGRLTSSGIATPLTFGVLRPRILLPDGWQRWSAARLAVVLDHEHAHLRRRDPLVQWLALLNRAVFWFHPLAWWLERRLAALAEEACDAAVLARGHSAADYSEHLLDLARVSCRRPMPQACMPMPGSALPARIAKILDGELGRAGSLRAVTGATAVATLVAAALGTITLAQEPAQPRNQSPQPSNQSAQPRNQSPQPSNQSAQPSSQSPQPNTQPPQPRSQPANQRNLADIYEIALGNDAAVREAGADDREAARQDLLLRVAESYFSVLTTKQTLAAQEASKALWSRQLEQTQRRFEVGLVGIASLKESQAAAEHAVADVAAEARALVQAQETLRQVVGQNPGELVPLVEDLPLTAPYPNSAEEWIEKARQRNPALVAARRRGAQRENLDLLMGETERETREAYLGVVSEIAGALALREAVRSNRSALEAAQRDFEVGVRTTVDVMAAQNTLTQIETSYALSQHDYAVSRLRLQHAAGALTVDGLKEFDAWFE
jgi:beta-lactamase regulating signal transducer with metallopeptidase domain